MKSSNISNRFFFLVLPFLLTGCYTQFQTTDRFALEKDRYSDYYKWDGYEEGKASKNGAGQETSYQTEEERYLEEEYALEESGIYYKDYETEQWYKDHYVDQYYWKGYDDGFDDGYYKGYRNAYRDSYVYGYTPWEFNSWWYRHHRYMHRHNVWLGLDFGAPFYAHVGSYWYDYYPPYYSYGYSYPYYSGWGYHWNYPYYNNVYVYNNYTRSQKYSRDADLYRKGPRSSGLVNRSDARSRSNYKGNRTGVRTRGVNTGSIRSRSTGNNTRVRGSGSSVGRSSSGTVNRGSRSRGSSVGKGRTNSGGSKSRGSGSSVGKSRSSGGSSSSGNTRSRGNGSNISSSSSLSVSTGSLNKERSYTIPTRRVNVNNRTTAKKSTFNDFFKLGDSQNSSRFSSRAHLNISKRVSGSNSSRSVFNSRKNSGTKSVTRSSTVTRSKSSSTKSRSSSSSKKRSRGNN